MHNFLKVKHIVVHSLVRFLFLLLTLFFSACQQKESLDSKQVFRFNTHSQPASLDPRLVKDIPSCTVSKMLFEGLYRLNHQGVPEQTLAQQVTIQDLDVTITLKPAFWTNGKPVTAYDFEASWKSVLDPSFPSFLSEHLFFIQDAKQAKQGLISLEQLPLKALNANTLSFKLETTTPYLFYILSHPITYPVPSWIIGNTTWDHSIETFVTNGPFQLEKLSCKNELLFRKNPNYYDASCVKLDRVILTMVPDEHTELNMYENQQIDWAGSPHSSLPPEALHHFSIEQRPDLVIQPLAATYNLEFNTQVEPFNDPKIRKAFAYILNRKAMIDNILQGQQPIAYALIPPMILGLETAFAWNENLAIQWFNEALEEHRWSIQDFPTVTLSFTQSEKHYKLAQAIQGAWHEAFKVPVELRCLEWNCYIEHLMKGDFQVASRGHVYAFPDAKKCLDPYQYPSSHPLGKNNISNWQNAEFSSCIQNASVTKDLTQRISYLQQAQTILMDQLPIAPLFHSTACYLKKPYVKNVYLSDYGDFDLKHAFIDR